jgi:hypothetical protein
VTSAARRKVDPQTLDMFDPEVDKPDHDAIVRSLYEDTDAMRRLLMEFHGLSPLRAFTEADEFSVTTYPEYSTPESRRLSYAEAVRQTGHAPTWHDPLPVRIVKRQMEVLLDYYPSESTRASRLMGFIDVGYAYDIVGWPSLCKAERSGLEWVRNEKRHVALFEVKGQWPTSGNLMRQLNLYAATLARGFDQGAIRRFVVGPDASVNALVCGHGYRLVTFDPSGQLTLRPDEREKASKRAENQF